VLCEKIKAHSGEKGLQFSEYQMLGSWMINTYPKIVLKERKKFQLLENGYISNYLYKADLVNCIDLARAQFDQIDLLEKHINQLIQS
jgi:hypothetical protein